MTSHLPLIAVLLPVYGRDNPKLFERSLSSIEQQDYPRDRVRIYLGVDGPLGSELEEVIQKNYRSFFKVLRSPSRQGLAGNLNSLIGALSSEQFVARQDADDVSLPYRFLLQLRYLSDHPEISVLGGAIREVDENEEECGVRRFPESAEVCRRLIARGVPVAHPSVMFNMRRLQGRLRYPEIRENEDVALWFELMAEGHLFSNLPDVVVNFRITSETIARRGVQKAIPEFKTYVKGLYRLSGVSIQMLFPAMRLIFRYLPSPVRRLTYRAVFLRDWLAG